MNKASQSAPTAYGDTKPYAYYARATASGGGGQGSLEWSNGNVRTEVGSQDTQARWSGNSNYNASSWSNTVTLTITKTNQSAPTAYGDSVQYGSTATATASGGGGMGSLEWSNGNTRTAVGSQTTRARWSGNGNYNASDWSNEVTLTVAPGTKDISTVIRKGSASPSGIQAEYITFTAGGSTYPILAQLGFDVAAEAIPYPIDMFGKSITSVRVETEEGEMFNARITPSTITDSTSLVTISLQSNV